MIEIKITGTTPLEALASVTAFGMHCMKNQDVHAAATRVLETEEGKVSKSDTALTAPMAPAAPAVSAPVNPTPAPVALVNPAPAPVAAVPVAGPQVTPPGNAPAVAPVAAAPAYTVEQIGKDKPFIYTAIVAIRPEVTLGEYKGIEVEKAEAAVAAEDVDAELKRVQEQNARQITV